MIQVDNITDSADQTSQVVLDDGSILVLRLRFRGATQRWTVDVTHPALSVAGMNICNFPNLLRSWRNIVPFGLACQTVSGQDPVDVQDFVNGNAALYVLNAEDVGLVEVNVFGGALQ